MTRRAALIVVYTVACMTDVPNKRESEPATTPPAVAANPDPPNPPDYVPPNLFGDGPPRKGPFDRSSVWIVGGPAGPVHHTVPCDTMEHPELRALLRILFAGTPPPPGTTAAPGARAILQIEWREHGKPMASSRLLDDGTLEREQAGTRTVDRRLDREAMAAVEVAIDRADLRDPTRTWCAPKP